MWLMSVDRVTPYISGSSSPYFAFNVWNLESARAVIDAAASVGQNVILQTSSKVYSAIEKESFITYIRCYARKKAIQAYVHLDHCKDLDAIYDAIEVGYDSVMIDASEMPLEQNIQLTNMVTKAAHNNNVLVEAEVGIIKKTFEYEGERNIKVASWEDICEFLRQTNIDMFAAAIGTAHGLYREIPQIDYGLIRRIGEITDIPFVVHGGTGLSLDVFRNLLHCDNVKKINISTEVKQTYRRAILECIENGNFEETHFEAASVQKYVHDSIENMALGKLSLLAK